MKATAQHDEARMRAMNKFGTVVLAVCITILTTVAAAGTNLNCTQALPFKKSNVNVAFLGYSYLGGLSRLGEHAKKLQSIIAADIALSQLAIKESGYIQKGESQDTTNQREDICTPESIISAMAGRLTPGETLISFWGNLIEQGDAISVQNFIDIRRGGSDDDITFDWERERKTYSFSARLPFARAAFRPRTIEASLIDEIAAAYGNLPAVRSVATGFPTELPPAVLSMRELFPELYLVEGGAWYSYVHYSYKRGRHDVGELAEKADEVLARFIRESDDSAGDAA